MASAESAVPVNGTYAHQYEANNYGAAAANSANTYNAAPQQPASNSSSAEIPKDEVAWYFVEQYYTTLSKTPEKLYLFYNKRSQFVSGAEEEKVQVCVGQKSINERIKALDFHDTKVRVTNVDSQGSDANIVIQVIGEISNKGQPHKRFVQTFVLAEQTNGYFVLNDIFRYLADEAEDEEPTQQDSELPSGMIEPAPTAADSTTEGEKDDQKEVAKSEEDLVKVDEKLEETVQEEAAPEPEAAAPAEAPEVAVAEDAPAAAVPATEEAPAAEPEAPAAEETAEPEKPKEPTPAPATEAPKPAAPVPAPAPKPAVPRTWASLAASAHKPAAPAAPAPAAQQAQAPPKPAAAAPAQQLAAPTVPSAPAREPSPANSQGEAAGWQSVTGHKKEQSRSQNQAPAGEAENKRAYIKNVYPQIEEAALKTALSKFGDIAYFDISRPKNCAFVDFKTLSGFQAAVKNNPHTVNGMEIVVEERRMRPQSGFNPFPRGGAPRGRGGMNQGQRGGFNPRGGRGGAGGRGGRPAPQEA